LEIILCELTYDALNKIPPSSLTINVGLIEIDDDEKPTLPTISSPIPTYLSYKKIKITSFEPSVNQILKKNSFNLISLKDIQQRI